MEICSNCERKIGKLETAHLIEGNIVCPDCEARVRRSMRRVGRPKPPIAMIVGLALFVAVVAIGGYFVWSNGDRKTTVIAPKLLAVRAEPTPVTKAAATQPETQPPPTTQPVVLPLVKPEPPPAPLPKPGSIRGGAWIVRKAGASDLLRGLEISILSDSVIDPAIIRAEYEDGIKKLQGELADRKKKHEDEKNENDRREKEYKFEVGRGMETFYLEYINKFSTMIGTREKAMQELSVKETLEIAYDHFATANSYYGTTHFYAVAKPLVLQTTNTDSEGKFTFEDVPPGKHYLYAVMDNSTAFIEWLVPFEVGEGKTKKIDIFNDNASTIYNK